jgi:hypothetical protein
MDDLGFILASYILTLGGMLVLARWAVRKARRLGTRLDREELPWT